MTRHRGRRLSHADLANTPPLIGELSYSSTYYRGNGYVPSLSLQAGNNQTREGQLAELYEPQMTGLGGDRMKFRGIESDDGVAYVQEWLVDVLAR